MSRKARRKPGGGKARAGKRATESRSTSASGQPPAAARGRSSTSRSGAGTPARDAPGAVPSVDEDAAAPADLSALESGKLYYRIGEVSQITGVKPYVLRYWESEFRLMAPQKSRSKQRLYRQKDIETILHIKRLLYEERYTIAGARRRLRELGAAGVKAAAPARRAAAQRKPEAPASDRAVSEASEGTGDSDGLEASEVSGLPGAVDSSEFHRIRDELVEIRALLFADL